MPRARSHAGNLSEAEGVVAEKAVLRGGLALPPGMLKERRLLVLQMAVCLVLLPRPSMVALLLPTATTLQAPTPVPLSTATNPTNQFQPCRYSLFGNTCRGAHHSGCSTVIVFALHLLLCRQSYVHSSLYDIQEVMCCSFVCCSCLWRGQVSFPGDAWISCQALQVLALRVRRECRSTGCFNAETG